MSTGMTDLQRELVAALATPHKIVSLAASFGVAGQTMQSRVKRCISSGFVVRVGWDCYVAVAAPDVAAHGTSALKRPQPVRDAILAFLTQERQAKEIADHIGRPVPNATGHLAAMGRRGLVVRTAYGRYQRTDLMLDGSRPAKIVRPALLKDAVLGCLDRPLHYSAVADRIGRSHNKVNAALHWLVASGHAVSRGGGVFAPPGDTSVADWKPPPTLGHAILSFLAEPHSMSEIAEQINRPLQATKAHLTIMCRRGLLTRVGYRRYQRSDTVPATSCPATIVFPTPKRDAAQAVLNRPLHYVEVGASIKVSHKAARSLLRRLVEAGYAVYLGRGIFAPSGSGHCLDHNGQRSVRAARADAGTGSNPEAPCTA